MNHHDFYPTCAFIEPQGGSSEREFITVFSSGPKRNSLVILYSDADYYLGFDLVVDSESESEIRY